MAAFLAGLPAGSVVADVGCGNGRYLASARPDVVVLGLDRCAGVGGGGRPACWAGTDLLRHRAGGGLSFLTI